MNKFKVGDRVLYEGELRTVIQVPYKRAFNEVGWLEAEYVVLDLGYENAIHYTDIELYKTPQERLFDLGFEKVAKHKFVKVNKGGSNYNTPYKITIEFAFNMYQVKCECENWVGVDLELADILVDYLKEMKKNDK